MGCASSTGASHPSKKPLVTLTGITGYVGSQTCLLFLKDGGFRVRGTVRDTKNEKKIAPIREAFGPYFDKLELVEADLLNEESLVHAIEGSTYVVHLASPFFMGDDEEQLVKPAVEGTNAVMKACRAAGVKRCVVTSSCVAVEEVAKEDYPKDGVFNESHWSNPDRPEGLPAYHKSKTLAEKAAWDFVKALPEQEKFELVTINPGLVMGPPLKKEEFTSGGICKGMLEGKMPMVPPVHM